MSLIDKTALDRLYERYNHRRFVHPDPLEFLYDYEELRDREVAGLVASSLAYGRVAQILKSVSSVLDRMAPSPARFLEGSSHETLDQTFAGFKHRFTTGRDLAAMLAGIGRIRRRFGSLHACFTAGLGDGDDSVLPALTFFAGELSSESEAGPGFLVPSPSRGSACKRLNLFLRWMVRRDDVDPGGWDGVPASMLIIPLDTHIYRICRALGMTERGQANLRTAEEITDAFRAIAPDDPIRYDFALSRLGIRNDGDSVALKKSLGLPVD